jgi:hypothetical protein
MDVVKIEFKDLTKTKQKEILRLFDSEEKIDFLPIIVYDQSKVSDDEAKRALKEVALAVKEFDFSNHDIPLTERGMNRNIKAHLLPDKEMVGLGFHKQADKWFCFKTLDQKYDISFCVEIDATNDALHISVIDEDFGQHYDYQRVLRDSPDSEVALNIWRKVEEQMKKLTDAGLITGHVYGRYI